MSEVSMEQLVKQHASAKKKMILGIVFAAVGFFLFYVGFILALSSSEAGAVLIILSLPFLGVGTPFLIIGIVKTIKASRQLNLAKRNAPAAGPQVQIVSEPVAAPVAEPVAAPVAEPVAAPAAEPVAAPVAEPVDAPAAEPVDAPAAEPVEEVVVEEAPAQTEAPRGTADLDWKKYNPLEAGVSMKAGKDYKFHRADGFAGSVPQKFVDRTFPRCPICCSNNPHWTISQHNQMSWKGNLYLFKCSACDSVISMSMPDVTTLGNGASGIVSNPSVGLTNLMVKSSAGKEVGAVYAVVESVGTSGVSPECEGKEFKLEHLQDMFLRQ